MKKIFIISYLSAFGQAFGGKKSKEETKYRNAFDFFMYSNANSVYEDDNIRLEIYDESLWVSNKTTKTIFIAVDQSFLIHNGSARPLYDNSKKRSKVTRKHQKKAVATEENLTITIAPKISENQSPYMDM
ncbi:MAG: hypothetical protein L6U16_06675 [Porphyromonadaceae bacterium]|nr:MAG: hypothetical protein L6U16_06675 [Porphyromonadaceae bacterium]